MNQTTTHRSRVATVQRWLRDLHHAPLAGTVDYAELIDRAAATWYTGRGAEGRARATTLVVRAAMLARGEQVRGAGRPRKWKPREPVE